jgi:Na+-transporting NADH:ubiquinone oxidoreductase subunit B
MTGVCDAFLYGLIEMLPMIIVSYVTGLGIEFIFAERRKHEIYEGFLVSGLLIPMVMPIGTPLWMVAVATAFAVIIGKEVFGGTGMNVFNPALLARAFAFFAYTPQMSGENTWFSSSSIHKFLGMDVAPVTTTTGATPLANLADHGTLADSAEHLSEFAAKGANVELLQNISVSDAFFGFIPGSMGETSTFAILIGAAILLFTGVASWRIMLSVFAGGLAMGYIFQSTGVIDYPAYYHLIVGGFAFGAVFMATDPVTSAQTNTGKWIYGLMVGILAVLIRVVNPAYPEGMMLSILFMNAMAPLIDYFVVERNIARRKKLIKNVK